MTAGGNIKVRIKPLLKTLPFVLAFTALGYFGLEAYSDHKLQPTPKSKVISPENTYVPATHLKLYRAPMSGDAGQYYLHSKNLHHDGTLLLLTSRVGRGNQNTSFTELKVDCAKKSYFFLAGSVEPGAKDAPTVPLADRSEDSEWLDVVKGSSKFDLVQFVCNQG